MRGKAGSSAPRRGSSLTTYIATVTAGLIVGMGAWSMSRAAPAGPTVTFGTAADTPAPATRAGHAIPTAATIDRHPVRRPRHH